MSNFSPLRPSNRINEGKRQTPEQVDKMKREKIREAVKTAKERMKSTPHNAKYYSAKLKYLEAKIRVLDAYKAMLKSKD